MDAKDVHISRSSPDYFHALDGIRGLLALIIAIFHTSWVSHIGHTQFLSNGPVVVDIFFVLSGFIMYRLYDGEIHTPRDGLVYLKKRLARIYPLHFAMLMVMMSYAIFRVAAHMIGIAHLDPGEILPFQAGAADTLTAFFANLTLIHSMGVLDQLSFNVPSWSISVEFFAYIVFTLMVLFFRPTRWYHFAAICAGIAVNYYWLSLMKPNLDFHYDLGFFRCLGGFFTGIVTAWVFALTQPRLPKKEDIRLGFSGTLAESGALLGLLWLLAFASGPQQFFIAPIGFALVFAFAIGRGFFSKLFASKLAVYLGKISYSIYMVHILFAISFGVIADKILPRVIGEAWNTNLIGGDILCLMYLAAVIVTSHFTYKWIEVPGRRYIMSMNFKRSRRLIPRKI